MRLFLRHGNLTDVSIAISRYFILSSVPVPKPSERLGLCLDDRLSAPASMISCAAGSLHSSIFDSDLRYLVPASYSVVGGEGAPNTIYSIPPPTSHRIHPDEVSKAVHHPSYSPQGKNCWEGTPPLPQVNNVD